MRSVPSPGESDDRPARILGYIGGIWGLLIAFILLNAMHLTELYQPFGEAGPVARLSVILIVLCLSAVLCVAANRRLLLTIIVVALVALDLVGIASYGFFLLPGIACLIGSVAMFWQRKFPRRPR